MPDQLGADTSAREKTADRKNAVDLDSEIENDVDLFAPTSSPDGDDSPATQAEPTDAGPEPDADPVEAASATGSSATGSSVSGSTEATGSSEAAAVVDASPAEPIGAAGLAGEAHPVDASQSEAPESAGLMARLGIRTRGQIRARKVQRIVRRVDPWSVLKVSLLFYFCVWVMVMVALILIWGTAMSSGTVGSLESFIAEFLAFEEFKFNGDQLFQIFALGGLIGVFVATAATAILAVLFNLIADLTGGIRFTVVEEESARRIINPR